MLSAVLVVTTPLKSVGWLVPTVIVALIALLKTRLIFSHLRKLNLPRNQSVAVFVGLFIGLILLVINWVRTPLSAIRAGGSVDMYFFEALSKGISEFGPAQSILMTGGQLRYHWFSYGWAGDLTSIANLESFVSLNRILPVVALIGVVFLAASWAGKIQIGKATSSWWVPSLAVILIVFGGYSGALYGVILNFDSPSQALTTVWLLALVVLFLEGLRSRSRKSLIATGILVAFMTVTTTGGKASHAIVALGGFGFVWLIGIVLRLKWWRKATLLLVFSVFGFVVTYLWVLAGVGIGENLAESILVRASTWQGLDPVTGRWGPLLGTVALLLAVVTRLSGIAWLARTTRERTSPEFLFGVGALAAGTLALLALRGGINDLWFLLAASAPLAVLSAYGVGQAQNWLQPLVKRGFVYSILIAIIASMVSLLLSRNWNFSTSPSDFFLLPGIVYWFSIVGLWGIVAVSAWLFVRQFQGLARSRKLGAFTAITLSALVFTSVFTRPAVLWTQTRELTTEMGIVTPEVGSNDAESVVNSDPEISSLLDSQLAAATWLRNNAQRDRIVATSNPGSSFIPALTGNQMFLAGERYQLGLGASGEGQEIEGRSALSRSLISESSAIATQELCQAGVSYLWLEAEDPPAILTQSKLHDFGFVTIIELPDECSVN